MNRSVSPGAHARLIAAILVTFGCACSSGSPAAGPGADGGRPDGAGANTATDGASSDATDPSNNYGGPCSSDADCPTDWTCSDGICQLAVETPPGATYCDDMHTLCGPGQACDCVVTQSGPGYESETCTCGSADAGDADTGDAGTADADM